MYKGLITMLQEDLIKICARKIITTLKGKWGMHCRDYPLGVSYVLANTWGSV